MKINPINNTVSPNFKAVKVAQTKNILIDSAPVIDLYKLHKSDRPFLKKLSEQVKYKKLMPYLSESLQKRWQKIFDYCITKAFLQDNNSYVAVSNNKVCGIMTYQYDNKNILNLDGICSIPIDTNKKVKQLRRAMFYQLFKDAQASDARGIKLEAVIDGPFDVVSMYEDLGFKQNMNSSKYVSMTCNKHKILYQLKELPFFVDYIESDDKEPVNLMQYLA